VDYDGVGTGGYFADLFAPDTVVVEVNSAEVLRGDHEVQILD